MGNPNIPIINIDNLSSSDELHGERLHDFIESFKSATGLAKGPDYIIRTPGRINIIGDHIDYHGFSVLPMAIDKSILVGLSRLSEEDSSAIRNINSKETNETNSKKRPMITIINDDHNTFPTYQCEHSFAHGSKLDQSHQWYHYVLCGYHGVICRDLLSIESSHIKEHSKSIVASGDHLDLDAQRLTGLPNIVLFIKSNLPSASGLSSSSALVCASALATKLILLEDREYYGGRNGETVKIDSMSLAEDCAKFEHLIGTAGGGMDQAVILTAQEGYAKHIEFMPSFRCVNVRLPDNVVWLVSHCGHECMKAATLGFNTRVLETKIAAALIVKTLSDQYPQMLDIPLDNSLTLGRVMRALPSGLNKKEFIKSVLDQIVLGNEKLYHMSIDAICTRIDMSRAELIRSFATSEEFLVKSELDKQVQFYSRCRHVLEEADRVSEFCQALETQRNSIDVHQLGELMTQSHQSLSKDYECSHPSLDKLVHTATRDGGACGARLTGAGWGGCVVTLVRADKADHVEAQLKEVSKFTFRTEPKFGATIIRARNQMM